MRPGVQSMYLKFIVKTAAAIALLFLQYREQAILAAHLIYRSYRLIKGVNAAAPTGAPPAGNKLEYTQTGSRLFHRPAKRRLHFIWSDINHLIKIFV
jgi:hypothetical protein